MGAIGSSIENSIGGSKKLHVFREWIGYKRDIKRKHYHKRLVKCSNGRILNGRKVTLSTAKLNCARFSDLKTLRITYIPSA